MAGLFMLALAVPTFAFGFYGSGPCEARDALEAYCVNHGGCPRNGYCYFPDGSYCELRSFYNGTCPGEAYYEQAMWIEEAYSFLYADQGYSAPYAPQMYPYYYPYYPYYYPYYYAPTVTIPSEPQEYIEKPRSEEPSAPSGVWYYCPGSKTYYPYVKECPDGWQTVPAQPPSEPRR